MAKPPDPMKSRESQPLEHEKVELQENPCPPRLHHQVNGRKQLHIRRVVGSNKDLAEVSAAVISCGPGPGRGTKPSKRGSGFPLLSPAIRCAR